MERLEVIDVGEMVGQQQSDGVGLSEDVGELVSLVARVQADDHNAEPGGGELGDVPGGTIGEPDGELVVGAKPEGGEAGGQRVDALEEVGEGEALLAEHDGLARTVAARHRRKHPVRGGLVEWIRRQRDACGREHELLVQVQEPGRVLEGHALGDLGLQLPEDTTGPPHEPVQHLG